MEYPSRPPIDEKKGTWIMDMSKAEIFPYTQNILVLKKIIFPLRTYSVNLLSLLIKPLRTFYVLVLLLLS